jgi:hypothetical protein
MRTRLHTRAGNYIYIYVCFNKCKIIFTSLKILCPAYDRFLDKLI